MRYVRRLPLSLKLIWLFALLLTCAALAIWLFYLFRFFSALGLPALDGDPLMLRLGLDLFLLSISSIFPVAWYARRFRRGGLPSAVLSVRQTLLAVVLLAFLPFAVLAMDLLAPSTLLIGWIKLGLSMLALVLVFGGSIFAGLRSTPSAGTASPLTSVTPAVPTATNDMSDSGGGASMDSPMQNPTPFKTAWWSFDLGQYRSCDGTYCFYAYESIPPIRELDGTLDWLGPLDPQTDREMEIHRNTVEARGKLAQIEADAAKLGVALPESFVRLMGSPELQDRIPSCTACFFRLSKHITPCVGAEHGYIVRFLNDQQDVLLWFLCLTPQGEQRVLVSAAPLDELDDEYPDGPSEDERNALIANTFVCAPSFDAFIYRWWLENTLWFKLNETGGADKLTDEERRYLAHYRPLSAR